MRIHRPRAATAVAACFVLAVTGLVACGGGPSGNPATTLTVLAGSELKDLEPLLPKLEDQTGVHLELDYTGSIDGAQAILNGTPADAAWFSLGNYLTLASSDQHKIIDQTRIMLSPVVIGVKKTVAQRFGWEDNPNVTWEDIAQKAAAGQFRYAMTNPAASNSGFSALVGVASAFAGTGNALTEQDIKVDELKQFFSGQRLTAGSSGFLADSFVRSQSSLDGMINYESILLELNKSGQLHEPLDLIYPKDGIITADYPFMLLNAAKRGLYQKVVNFFLAPAQQQWIMQNTDRRPVIPQVHPDSRFPKQILVELQFPSTLKVVNALLDAYLNEIRPPSHAIFVLDTSGSMAGSRLQSLQRALTGLTGLDDSLTGQFAQFRAREDLTFITFSDRVHFIKNLTVDTTDPNGPSMTAVREFVNGLQAGGNTAIFSALDTAYHQAVDALRSDPTRLTSVVLMTDGENNSGISFSRFSDDLKTLGSAAQQVRTFPVLFGDADPQELHEVADETGGEVFDGRSESLSVVFKEIRGFQ
ncbi:MAG TPA: VWA domain-containing protein [Actinomycetota bacterium]|jgi:Ca-activated chloride channel family protein